MEIRVMKREFYNGYRWLIRKIKHLFPEKVRRKLNFYEIKLYGKMRSTYTPDERIEQFNKAMEGIKAIAPKNVFEPCYYGDTEENYEWNNDDYEEEPYDYGIGFNYLNDEEYDEANGIQQEEDSIFKYRIAELESSIENLVAKMASIKARATMYSLDGTEKESFDMNIGVDDLCQSVAVTQDKIDKFYMSPAEYEMALDKMSEIAMLEGIKRFYKSDEGLKPTVENGGNHPL